jgi:hypothetical protein
MTNLLMTGNSKPSAHVKQCMTSPLRTLPVLAAAAAFAFTLSACGDDDTTTTTPTTAPATAGAGADAGSIEDVVGMDVSSAESALADLGYEMRIVRLDGEDLAVTMDYREDRVNVEVEDDTVVAVQGIG